MCICKNGKQIKKNRSTNRTSSAKEHRTCIKFSSLLLFKSATNEKS